MNQPFKQLQQYFHWHLPGARNLQKKNTTLKSSSSVFTEAPSQSHCRLQEIEVYSKLYYADRIMPAINECLKVSTGRSSIMVIKEVTKEIFEGEEDEIKSIVAAKVSASQMEAPNATAAAAAEDVTQSPAQFQE